jgi:trigger factor
MQVTETSAEGLKREYRVVVPAAEVGGEVENKLDELRRTVKIDGFRPGKVPMSILRKRFGPSVLGEVLEGLVGRSSAKALEDQGVRPALRPDIEVKTFGEETGLEYIMSVEALPEIEATDPAKLSFTRLKAAVTDEAVDKAIEGIAKDQKNFVAVEGKRGAKEGDLVVIDFVGTIDGEAFDGGTAEGASLELGSGSFIPGFEEQLVGAKVGDNKTVAVKFPDDYASEAVRGKDASFAVDVKELQEPKPVTVDDELAKQFGLPDLAGLRDAMRAQIERQYSGASRVHLKRAVLDAFAEAHDFEVPEGMVEREFESIWKQIEDDMERTGTTWEASSQSEEEARAEYRVIAERRVRLGLVLTELGSQNEILVPQDELNRAVMEQARRFPGQEQKIFDYFSKSPEAMNELRAPLYEDKVIDFVIEMATVTDKDVSPEELLGDPDEVSEAATKDDDKAKDKAKAKAKAKAKDDGEDA